MNESSAQFTPPEFTANTPAPRKTGRPGLMLAGLFFIAQLAFFFFFGTKNQNHPRPVTNVSQLRLTEKDDPMAALTDPTLFALPNWHDFSAKLWTDIPTNAPPDFGWQEPPRWLDLNPADLASGLNLLKPETATETPLDFKTAPATEFTPVATEVFFPAGSSLKISGPLAQRKLLSPVLPPTLTANDVLAPTRTQLLVGPDGAVVSVVLLDSSGLTEADQAALRLAKAAQFTPARSPTFGEMIFKWHTEPANDPDTKRAK